MEKKTPIEELALLFSRGNDELKLEACNEILSLSGTEAMIDEFLNVHHIINPELVRLMRLKNDLSLKAGSVLVNLSSHTVGSRSLVGVVESTSHHQCLSDSMRSSVVNPSSHSRSLVGVECPSHHQCLSDSMRSSVVNPSSHSRSLVGVECPSQHQCLNDSMSHVRSSLSSHSVGSLVVECDSHHQCLNDSMSHSRSSVVNLSSQSVGSLVTECASHHQCLSDSMSHVRSSLSSHSVGSPIVECASHHPCLSDSVRSSLVQCCVENICDCNSNLADVCCMILSNISRDPACLEVLKGEIDGEILEKFMKVLFEENFNKSGCNLDYLAHFLANIAQDTVLRSYIIERGKKFKKYFLETLHSVELLGLENKCRKQGLLSLYRNLSLSKDSHGLFLDGPVVQLFTSALFALVNSIKYDNANHIEECKKSMDPELCILVLDTLLIFCATKRGRIILRESDVYIALKEVHSTSSDKAIEIATEKIVDILIRTEDEIGVNDYLDLEIPDHLVEKFKKYDLEDANEIEGSKIKLK